MFDNENERMGGKRVRQSKKNFYSNSQMANNNHG